MFAGKQVDFTARSILNQNDTSTITYFKKFPNSVEQITNITKTEKELGWDRTYKFEDGMKETIDWYVNNQEWIDNILSGEYKEAYKD